MANSTGFLHNSIANHSIDLLACLPFYCVSDFDFLSLCNFESTDKNSVNRNAFYTAVTKQLPKPFMNNIMPQYITTQEIKKFYSKAKSSDSLKVFHINIRSLNANHSKLEDFFTNMQEEFDIILLSEVWSTNLQAFDSTFGDYQYFYVTPQNNTKAGGVAAYIKKQFSPELISSGSIGNGLAEYLAIKVKYNKLSISVITTYRHPNSSVPDFIRELQTLFRDTVKGKNSNSIYVGDINLDLNKYAISNEIQQYYDFLFSIKMLPYSIIPTRVTCHSATVIDHVFSNIEYKNDVMISSATLCCDITDHLANVLLITPRKSKVDYSTRPYIRIFSQRNFNNYLRDIELTDWSNIYSCSDVNQGFSLFIESLQMHYDKNFPLVRMSRKKFKNKKWITPGIEKSILTKHKLYNKFLLSQSEQDKNTYLQQEKLLKKVIAKAKSDYYKQVLAAKSNSAKSIWQALNTIYTNKPNCHKANFITLDTCTSDDTLHNKQDIANAFNKYFVNIAANITNNSKQATSNTSNSVNNFHKYLKNRCRDSFFLEPVTEIEVLSTINSIKKGNSSGPDGLSPNLIKHIKSHIISPLAYLINMSFQDGTFPKILKTSKVIPIFKKGSPTSASNYRPISLLSCIGKILEKVMSSRINKFFDKHGVFCNSQYGFRKAHSTVHAVIDSVNTVNTALAQNNHVLGIFCDLEKAFDCVNHQILLTKLNHYGVRGVALKWFESYLNGRLQFTYVNGTCSSTESVLCGVPQGSVLGPLLFTIYINDLPNICFNGSTQRLKLFADDSNLFIIEQNILTLFKTSNLLCSELSSWFSSNKLSLNANKTKFILFKPNKKVEKVITEKDLKILLDQNAIQRVQCTTFLGVVLDEDLQWRNHIDYLNNKLKRFMAILYNKKLILPESSKKLLYFAYAHSILSYGIELYGTAKIAHLQPLIVTFHKVLRMLQNKPRDTPVKTLYNNYSIFSLPVFFKFKILMLVYKCLHTFECMPANLCAIFNTGFQTHNYNTRSINSSVLNIHASDAFYSSYGYIGCKLWNSLPYNLKKCETVNCFKKKLKTHLCTIDC